ncbi:hypothetical protein SCFA_240004 [anaerobic digester metagenome]|uniref:Uncharacterized protein n=1 Tax=anaerobic digester metagenome TaxID=1263854 RepID=A0A485LZ60_9ZZZZ
MIRDRLDPSGGAGFPDSEETAQQRKKKAVRVVRIV